MRDEFNRETVDALAKRVGVRCSNPSCRRITTGPRSDTQRIVNIGVAAHITAAAVSGPRFDVALNSEQRGSIANGIWLCQNCAKLIDNDPARYSVQVLNDWKTRAEASALAEIEGGPGGRSAEDFAELGLSYRELRIGSERHDYRLEVALSNLGSEPITRYHVDLEMPARIAEQPRTNVLYVRDRSSADIAFFRVSDRNHREPIYPGDTKLIGTFEYFVDNDLFWNRGNLFEQGIRATLYRPGFQPVSVERPVGDLQNF